MPSPYVSSLRTRGDEISNQDSARGAAGYCGSPRSRRGINTKSDKHNERVNDIYMLLRDKENELAKFMEDKKDLEAMARDQKL